MADRISRLRSREKDVPSVGMAIRALTTYAEFEEEYVKGLVGYAIDANELGIARELIWILE